MSELVSTSIAVRVMGVWVRRADAVIGNGGLANAARAVAEDRDRLARHELELAAIDSASRWARLPAAG